MCVGAKLTRQAILSSVEAARAAFIASARKYPPVCLEVNQTITAAPNFLLVKTITLVCKTLRCVRVTSKVVNKWMETEHTRNISASSQRLLSKPVTYAHPFSAQEALLSSAPSAATAGRRRTRKKGTRKKPRPLRQKFARRTRRFVCAAAISIKRRRNASDPLCPRKG